MHVEQSPDIKFQTTVCAHAHNECVHHWTTDVQTGISHGTMIGGHRWQKIRGKIVVLSRVREIRFEDVPVPKEHHDVEYRYSRVADILQIGWETNTSHAECGQLSI